MSNPAHLFSFPMRVLLLLSPLLSGHQGCDTLSLVLFLKYNEGKYNSEIHVGGVITGPQLLWTSNDTLITCLFQKKVMFVLKVMLIYDKALLGG